MQPSGALVYAWGIGDFEGCTVYSRAWTLPMGTVGVILLKFSSVRRATHLLLGSGKWPKVRTFSKPPQRPLKPQSKLPRPLVP
jgi:hypothetical protein